MSVPEPWAFVLLGLAAFRLWRLLAEDTVLDRPRRWLLRGDPDAEVVSLEYRDGMSAFLLCPWCLGFHLALGVYLLWVWLPTETLTVSAPLAISSFVGLVGARLN